MTLRCHRRDEERGATEGVAAEFRSRPPITWVVAAVLLGVKAVLGLWAALVVLVSSPTRPQSFLGHPVSRRGVLVGLLLVALVAVTVAVAVALVRGRPAARWAGLVLELVAVALALSRLDTRPTTAYVALVLSGAVILLLIIPLRPRPGPVTDRGPRFADELEE